MSRSLPSARRAGPSSVLGSLRLRRRVLPVVALLLLGSLAVQSAPRATADTAPTVGPTVVVPAGSSQVNIAPYARATASDAVSGTSAAALNDGGVTQSTGIKNTWIAPGAGGTWAKLSWPRVQTLTAIQLVGTSETQSRVLAGKLTFSDGSVLPVGQVVGKTAYPTTVAFEPRTVSWVKFEPTTVAGSGTMGLAEIRAFPIGVTPWRLATPSSGSLASDPTNPVCRTAAPTQPTAGLVYALCPVTSTRVSGTQTVSFYTTGVTKVRVSLWPGDSTKVASSTEVAVPANGRAQAKLNFATVSAGPLTVALEPTAGPALASAKGTYLQLYNVTAGTTSAGSPRTVPPGYGRTVVYDEEFNAPISYSLDGRVPTSDYASGKPEWWGTGQFGSAIFADPPEKFGNLQIVDRKYLRISTLPTPSGYTDPTGWNRKYTGGLLASARAGGSGFSAQLGYFEARMLVPGNPGTWPAFWLLPANNIVAEQREVAEIDAIELYGHDPATGCFSTHFYKNNTDTANTQCQRTFSSVRDAATWHTYGVDVKRDDITYYIDGKEVLTVPQVGAGDQAMFFMVNLELGGGWPVQLDTVNQRSAMYVDYIRVYS